MSFIGVVASRKCFEKIKNRILEKIKEENINFIHINLRSIENVKNIKFETIILEDKLEKFKNKKDILEKLCHNSEYVIINTDINPEKIEIKDKKKEITYGLNQKAIVTVSSISDSDILIYWQKNIENKAGKLIEIEEKRIKRNRKDALKIYEILILYTFFKVYDTNIIEEI